MPLKRRKAKALVVIILILLAAGLSAWTLESPEPLSQLTSAELLKDSVFTFAPSQSTLNISDSGGNFRFLLGFDYPNSSILAGSATVFKVYIALTSEQLSFFARGIYLSVQDATLLVDGRVDRGVTVVTSLHSTLDTVSFNFVNTSLPAGVHKASARLLISTIDDFYVGSLEGSTQVDVLNGTFTIV